MHTPLVRRPSPAVLLAFVALCVALGGTSWAQDAVSAAKKLITGKQIAEGAIKSKQVKNGSLRAVDFRAGALPKGPKGEKGDKGDPGPSTGAAGGDLTGTYPNPTIAAGAVGSDELSTIPAVRLTKSGNQPVNNGTTTEITWETEDYDTAGLHNGSDATVTASRAGIYSVGATIEWSPNATGRRLLTLLSGTTVIARDSMPPIATFQTAQNVSTVVRLDAGQSVRVTAFQDSGANLTANSEAAAPAVFTVSYLGKAG